MADKKPIADLSRSSDSGNAFAVLAACKRAGERAGWPKKQVDEVLAEMRAGDYDHLLATASQYFDLKLTADEEFDEEDDEGTCANCGGETDFPIDSLCVDCDQQYFDEDESESV